MTQASATIDRPAAQHPALGRHTSRGFVWMVGQTLFTKVLALAAQIVLAWYLVREDFGLFGLALAVASIPSLLRDAGLQTILVQRQKRFNVWAGPVFWMSLVLGIASGIILAATAPIAAYFYKAPALTGQVLLLAVGSPLTALATVPAARVAADLRFRFQAGLALVAAVATTALNILLARWHWGAYAMTIPYVLANVLRTVVLWLAAPVHVQGKMQVRRWKYLVGDSGILLVTAAFAMLVANGDYATLGYFRGAEVVGIFYFAFNLSLQTLALMSANVGAILFPALSKLQSEQGRQIGAYLQAARTFAAVAIPLCLLQAICAGPGIRLLFKPLWYPAIAPLAILSVAMAIRAASLPAGSLAAAQRWFRLTLAVMVFDAVLFLTMVALAAHFGGQHATVAVAVAELIFFGLTDPGFALLMLRLNKRSVKDWLGVYAAPLLAGGVSAIVAAAAIWLPIGQNRISQAVRLGVMTLVMAGCYVPLLRLIAPSTFAELSSRIRGMLHREQATAVL